MKTKVCYGEMQANLFLASDPIIRDKHIVVHPEGTITFVYHYEEQS